MPRRFALLSLLPGLALVACTKSSPAPSCGSDSGTAGVDAGSCVCPAFDAGPGCQAADAGTTQCPSLDSGFFQLAHGLCSLDAGAAPTCDCEVGWTGASCDVCAPGYVSDGGVCERRSFSQLTDLYVFDEGDLANDVPRGTNLVVAIIGAGHLPPREQGFFPTSATYTLHVGAIGQGASARTNLSTRGTETLKFELSFGQPEVDGGTQGFDCAVLPVDAGIVGPAQRFPGCGQATPAPPGLAYPPLDTPVVTVVNAFSPTLNGAPQAVSVFAGLREDPEFFDETQYRRVWAGIRGTAQRVIFRDSNTAIDASKDRNALAVVFRLPIAALGSNGETVFDFWATVDQVGMPVPTSWVRAPLLPRMLLLSPLHASELLSVPPRQQAAFLQVHPDVADDLWQSLFTWAALSTLSTGADAGARALDEMTAVIPTVLRIDDAVPSPLFGPGCTTALDNPNARVVIGGDGGEAFPVFFPAAGRQIQDPAVDIWIAMLLNGVVTFGPGCTGGGDGVCYTSSAVAQGHQLLNGQPSPGCSASQSAFFPYLPNPN